MKTRIVKRMRIRRACPSAKWHKACGLLMDDLLPRTFNMALKENKRLQNEGKRTLTYFEMINRRKFFDRVRESIPELRRYNARIPKDMLKRLSLGLASFHAGIRGMPRYKGRNRSVDSFTVSADGGCVIRKSGFKNPKANRTKTNGPHWGIHIMGLGFCRFKGSPPKGNIKEVTVQRTAKRVNFVFSVEETIEALDRRDEPVTGIDVGTKDMITLSSGEKIPGRKRDLDEIKELQRKMARQKKGSKSYEKTRRRLRKAWQSMTDSEKGFRHRMSTDLVRNHGPNFAMEERAALILMNMRKSEGKRGKRRNRQIREQCWGDIARKIGYKAEDAGGWLREVNPAYTSLDCHKCGSRKTKEDLPLNNLDRLYDCSCGLSIDRDENGAINIAIRALGKEPGWAAMHSGPGGVRLSCGSKQSEEGKPQNSAPSHLQMANPGLVPGEGAHCGGGHVSGSLA